MAAGYFLPIFAGYPFRNDNCKDMPIMVNMTEIKAKNLLLLKFLPRQVSSEN